MAHVDTVKQIYDAFLRGDLPAILGCLADDVDWEYGGLAEVPWLAPRRGRAQVPAFFQALSAVDIQVFSPKTFLESDRTVVVLIDFEATVKATGKRVVEEDEVHIWHFDESGMVSRFRHRADTYRQWSACAGR